MRFSGRWFTEKVGRARRGFCQDQDQKMRRKVWGTLDPGPWSEPGHRSPVLSVLGVGLEGGLCRVWSAEPPAPWTVLPPTRTMASPDRALAAKAGKN